MDEHVDERLNQIGESYGLTRFTPETNDEYAARIKNEMQSPEARRTRVKKSLRERFDGKDVSDDPIADCLAEFMSTHPLLQDSMPPIEKPQFREKLSQDIKKHVAHLGYVGDVEDPILQVWLNRYAIAGTYVEWLEKENAKLSDKLERAQNCLVAATIADPGEVIETTLEILQEGEDLASTRKTAETERARIVTELRAEVEHQESINVINTAETLRRLADNFEAGHGRTWEKWEKENG